MSQRKSIILNEETGVAPSPLRRSSRIANSPAPIPAPKSAPISRRRSSATLETVSTPVKRITRRASLSQDTTAEPTPSKRNSRVPSKSPSDKPPTVKPTTAKRTTRRASLNSVDSDASRSDTPSVARRRSVRGESTSPSRDEPAKTKTRRTSITEGIVALDPINESEEKRPTRGRPRKISISSVTTIQEEGQASSPLNNKECFVELTKLNLKSAEVRRSLRGRSLSTEEPEKSIEPAKPGELNPIKEDAEDEVFTSDDVEIKEEVEDTPSEKTDKSGDAAEIKEELASTTSSQELVECKQELNISKKSIADEEYTSTKSPDDIEQVAIKASENQTGDEIIQEDSVTSSSNKSDDNNQAEEPKTSTSRDEKLNKSADQLEVKMEVGEVEILNESTTEVEKPNKSTGEVVESKESPSEVKKSARKSLKKLNENKSEETKTPNKDKSENKNDTYTKDDATTKEVDETNQKELSNVLAERNTGEDRKISSSIIKSRHSSRLSLKPVNTSLSKSLSERDVNVKNLTPHKRLSSSYTSSVQVDTVKLDTFIKQPLEKLKQDIFKSPSVPSKDSLLINELEMEEGSDGSFHLHLTNSQPEINTSTGSNNSDKENVDLKSPNKAGIGALKTSEFSSTPKLVEASKSQLSFDEPMEVEYATDVDVSITKSHEDKLLNDTSKLDSVEKENCSSPIKKMKPMTLAFEKAEECKLLDSFIDETLDGSVLEEDVLGRIEKISIPQSPKHLTPKGKSPKLSAASNSAEKSKTPKSSDKNKESVKEKPSRQSVSAEVGKKLDDLISSQIANFIDSSDDDDIKSCSSGFVLTQAEEGEEDTPSEDSNQIIDEGESLHSSESESNSDESYERDSFVADDDCELEELLSGDEYDLGQEKKPKGKKKRLRIIPVSDSDDDVIEQKQSPAPVSKKIVPTETADKASSPAKVKIIQDIVVNRASPLTQTTNVPAIIVVNDEDNLVSLEEIKVGGDANKSTQSVKLTETPANTPAAVVNKKGKRKSKRSISLEEKIDMNSFIDADISKKISETVDNFRESLKATDGTVKINISLDYANSSPESEKPATNETIEIDVIEKDVNKSLNISKKERRKSRRSGIVAVVNERQQDNKSCEENNVSTPMQDQNKKTFVSDSKIKLTDADMEWIEEPSDVLTSKRTLDESVPPSKKKKTRISELLVEQVLLSASKNKPSRTSTPAAQTKRLTGHSPSASNNSSVNEWTETQVESIVSPTIPEASTSAKKSSKKSPRTSLEKKFRETLDNQSEWQETPASDISAANTFSSKRQSTSANKSAEMCAAEISDTISDISAKKRKSSQSFDCALATTESPPSQTPHKSLVDTLRKSKSPKLSDSPSIETANERSSKKKRRSMLNTTADATIMGSSSPALSASIKNKTLEIMSTSLNVASTPEMSSKKKRKSVANVQETETNEFLPVAQVPSSKKKRKSLLNLQETETKVSSAASQEPSSKKKRKSLMSVEAAEETAPALLDVSSKKDANSEVNNKKSPKNKTPRARKSLLSVEEADEETAPALLDISSKDANSGMHSEQSPCGDRLPKKKARARKSLSSVDAAEDTTPAMLDLSTEMDTNSEVDNKKSPKNRTPRARKSLLSVEAAPALLDISSKDANSGMHSEQSPCGDRLPKKKAGARKSLSSVDAAEDTTPAMLDLSTEMDTNSEVDNKKSPKNRTPRARKSVLSVEAAPALLDISSKDANSGMHSEQSPCGDRLPKKKARAHKSLSSVDAAEDTTPAMLDLSTKMDTNSEGDNKKSPKYRTPRARKSLLSVEAAPALLDVSFKKDANSGMASEQSPCGGMLSKKARARKSLLSVEAAEETASALLDISSKKDANFGMDSEQSPCGGMLPKKKAHARKSLLSVEAAEDNTPASLDVSTKMVTNSEVGSNKSPKNKTPRARKSLLSEAAEETTPPLLDVSSKKDANSEVASKKSPKKSPRALKSLESVEAAQQTTQFLPKLSSEKDTTTGMDSETSLRADSSSESLPNNRIRKTRWGFGAAQQIAPALPDVSSKKDSNSGTDSEKSPDKTVPTNINNRSSLSLKGVSELHFRPTVRSTGFDDDTTDDSPNLSSNSTPISLKISEAKKKLKKKRVSPVKPVVNEEVAKATASQKVNEQQHESGTSEVPKTLKKKQKTRRDEENKNGEVVATTSMQKVNVEQYESTAAIPETQTKTQKKKRAEKDISPKQVVGADIASTSSQKVNEQQHKATTSADPETLSKKQKMMEDSPAAESSGKNKKRKRRDNKTGHQINETESTCSDEKHVELSSDSIAGSSSQFGNATKKPRKQQKPKKITDTSLDDIPLLVAVDEKPVPSGSGLVPKKTKLNKRSDPTVASNQAKKQKKCDQDDNVQPSTSGRQHRKRGTDTADISLPAKKTKPSLKSDNPDFNCSVLSDIETTKSEVKRKIKTSIRHSVNPSKSSSNTCGGWNVEAEPRAAPSKQNLTVRDGVIHCENRKRAFKKINN